MPTAVSSTSPISAVTPGPAAPAAATANSGAVKSAGPAKSADATADASTETSDFNSVLSPILKGTDTGAKGAGAALPIAEGTPTTANKLGSDATSVLPEGLELTAVLQQAAAAKGNALPADGKGLPTSPADTTAETVEDTTLLSPLQATSSVTNATGKGELPVQKAGAQSSKSDGTKPEDELLANLALPAQVSTPAATATEVPAEAVQVDGKSAKGEDATADAQAAAQQALLSGVPEAVTAQIVNASQAKPDQIEDTDAESQLATAMLSSNSKSSAQHADAAKSAVDTALQAGDGSKTSTAESALTDLMPASTDLGKNDDAVKAGGFGKLLEAQAAANTTAQQPTADAAALNSKSLTGAVAYRMEGNTQVATTLVNQPVDSPQWSNEIGERVVWFGANKIQHAEIELDPPELGPLQVRISTVNDQTSISFTSHHAGVREVLDQSLPKLKEMFSDQGLNLVQADVGERRGSQQQHQQFDMGDSSGTSKENVAGDEETDGSSASKSSATTKMRLGLVDAYA